MKRIFSLVSVFLFLLFLYSVTFAQANTEDRLKTIIDSILKARPTTKYCNGVIINIETDCNVSYSPTLNLNGVNSAAYMPANNNQTAIPQTSQSGGGGGGGSSGNNMLMTMVPNILSGMLQKALQSVGGNAGKSGQGNGGAGDDGGYTGDGGAQPPPGGGQPVGGQPVAPTPSAVEVAQNKVTSACSDTGSTQDCALAKAELENAKKEEASLAGTCNSGEANDSQFRQMLNQAQIKVTGASSFQGELKDGVLMLKMLMRDCNCTFTINSGTRAGRGRGQDHGPGTRSFDLSASQGLTNFIRSKGSGGPCWYNYKGIQFLDEIKCPSAGATGPHWHVRGGGWKCGL